MLIRSEESTDYVSVHEVNAAAFDTPAEANLVDVLRKEAHPIISLVAEDNGKILGHIMFSPVSLSDHVDLQIMGLAPLAVLPGYQRKGIGSALVKKGLVKCQELGFGAVVVLGHARYYPRFGFLPSTVFGIQSEYDVPEEVFMVKELIPGYLRHGSGMIQYHAAFKNV
jgi:putative acetyltransferase